MIKEVFAIDSGLGGKVSLKKLLEDLAIRKALDHLQKEAPDSGHNKMTHTWETDWSITPDYDETVNRECLDILIPVDDRRRLTIRVVFELDCEASTIEAVIVK